MATTKPMTLISYLAIIAGHSTVWYLLYRITHIDTSNYHPGSSPSVYIANNEIDRYHATVATTHWNIWDQHYSHCTLMLATSYIHYLAVGTFPHIASVL